MIKCNFIIIVTCRSHVRWANLFYPKRTKLAENISWTLTTSFGPKHNPPPPFCDLCWDWTAARDFVMMECYFSNRAIEVSLGVRTDEINWWDQTNSSPSPLFFRWLTENFLALSISQQFHGLGKKAKTKLTETKCDFCKKLLLSFNITEEKQRKKIPIAISLRSFSSYRY